MIDFLKRPYPTEFSLPRTLLVALLFGLFIFLFLFFFQPFGIALLGQRKLAVCAGFGIVSMSSIAFLNGLIAPLFPRLFDEQGWTVGKEISWSLFHSLLIGLVNALYFTWISHESWSLEIVLTYEVYTLAVGVFPITISVLIKEVRLNRQYQTQSTELTEHLHRQEISTAQIVLPSDNKNEDLTLSPDQVVYLESSDNYVTVFFQEGEILRKSVLRSTLKAQEEVLATIPHFFRAHKSYLVNCNRIKAVSGNAQGYKLKLDGVETLIPVSRKQNEELRKRVW